MTQENPKRGQFNIGSMIGWIIFILVIAGGPLLNLIQTSLGGGVQLSGYLPYIIGGLVLLSAMVSLVRTMGGSRQAERPTPPIEQEPISAPARDDDDEMDRFDPRTIPPVRLPPASIGTPPVPRIEPMFSPLLFAILFIGLLALAGFALLVLGPGLP